MTDLMRIQSLRHKAEKGLEFWIWCASIDLLIGKDPMDSLENALKYARAKQKETDNE